MELVNALVLLVLFSDRQEEDAQNRAWSTAKKCSKEEWKTLWNRWRPTTKNLKKRRSSLKLKSLWRNNQKMSLWSLKKRSKKKKLLLRLLKRKEKNEEKVSQLRRFLKKTNLSIMPTIFQKFSVSISMQQCTSLENTQRCQRKTSSWNTSNNDFEHLNLIIITYLV